MDEELKAIGISDEQKKKVFKLIDRIDKMPPEVWDDSRFGRRFEPIPT